jgi:SOUL heme-binding protein
MGQTHASPMTRRVSAAPIEEPTFVVREIARAIEVRDYPASIAAEVSVVGDLSAGAKAGFRRLAGYIFGGNSRRQKIPLTAPVLQTGAPGAWTVRFVMPKDSSLETLPPPNDSRVRLIIVQARRYAVIRFSGLARAGNIVRNTRALSAFIQRRGLQADGLPLLARYNQAWTPWFMRRNEVWLPLRAVGRAFR